MSSVKKRLIYSQQILIGQYGCLYFKLKGTKARLATPKLRFRTRDQRIERAVLTTTDSI
jgi:hypothetical protein